jgi:peptidoglycan biosynthesis protein MviN/MurJ (putative lipid II flippase)
MAERPLPFPRPGERLVDGPGRPEQVAPDDAPDELWASLTIGGRILVCLVAAIGVLGLVGVVADAVFGGVHGDQEGGVLFVLVILVVGALLAVVVGLDAGFRAVRTRVANKPR